MKQLSNIPNFIKWFGESTTIDVDGAPDKFYHRSRSKKIFDEFKLHGEEVVKNPYNKDHGFFFVQEKDSRHISYIGDGIEIISYLRIENPFLIFDDGEGTIVDVNGKVYAPLYITEELALEAINNGHDGIVIVNKKHYSQYVVFNPNQIKSVDNNGEFSTESNNIFK